MQAQGNAVVQDVIQDQVQVESLSRKLRKMNHLIVLCLALVFAPFLEVAVAGAHRFRVVMRRSCTPSKSTASRLHVHTQ
jgi:nitrate reductase NapE component